MLIDGIFGFFDEYRFLSNFYLCKVTYEGLDFPSSENAYQAAKCEADPDRQKFLTISPGASKRLGRSIKIRHDWEQIKISVMREILKEKFKNTDLKDLLLATEELFLEETNSWGDTFWGVCNGKGSNVLGNLLMEIREQIR